MFDVMVKCIAVADAFESETGRRLESFNKVCVRRSKSAISYGWSGKTQRPRRQLGNCNHAIPPILTEVSLEIWDGPMAHRLRLLRLEQRPHCTPPEAA